MTYLATDLSSGGVPIWAQVLLAAVPIIGAFLAYRQATKATLATREVEDKKVDAEAYLVAKGFYEDMLVERKSESMVQQTQISQLNEQIHELQRSLNSMQTQVNLRYVEETHLREQLGRLGLELFGEQRRTQNLYRRVLQLEAHLQAINEVVPVAVAEPNDITT